MPPVPRHRWHSRHRLIAVHSPTLWNVNTSWCFRFQFFWNMKFEAVCWIVTKHSDNEFHLSTSHRLAQCPADLLLLLGDSIEPVCCFHDLGVVDQDLSVASHVSHVTSVSFFHLRQLRLVRRSLTTDTAHALVRAIIHIQSPGLLQWRVCRSASGSFQLPLSSVLRAAARLVLGLYQTVHRSCQQSVIRFIGLVILSVSRLNSAWQPTNACTAGHHLTSPGSAHRCPRLSAAHSLAFCRSTQTVRPPHASTSTFGPRAFCSSGLLSWNALSSQLRDPAIFINIFRQSLKTYLFNNNYSDWLFYSTPYTLCF